MKIAAATSGEMMAGHFGSADVLTIFTVENDEITSTEVTTRSAGCGCRSGIVEELLQREVEVVLAGSMGPGAYALLRKNNIQVIRGCSGAVFPLIENYLDGNLSDSPAVCEGHGHEHGHLCNHHH